MINVKKVLVVEDDEMNLKLYQMAFERQEWTVSYAKDGETAINFISNDSYNLVVLDIALPDMTGLDVLRELRNRPEGINVVVVAVTGYASKTHRKKVLEAGCDHFVSKPFSVKKLTRFLNNIFNDTPDPLLTAEDVELS